MSWEPDPELKKEALQELHEFWPEKSVKELDRNLQPSLVCAQDWKSIREYTPESVRAFYDNTEGVIYDLMFMSTVGSEQGKPELIEELCAQHECLKVLDFGGGVGWVSKYLAERGYEVTYTDLGKAFEFAKWRFARENLKIAITHADDFRELLEFYEAIVATEFFEHVFDPVSYAKSFYRMLKPYGILIANTTSFGPHDSGHLPMHYHYSHYSNPQGDSFDEELKRVGFVLKETGANIYSIKCFQKVEER